MTTRRAAALPASSREGAVLTLSVEGRSRWESAVARASGADIYFHPGYAKVFERHGDGRAHCLLLERGGGLLLYPFLIREIPADLVREAGLDAPLYDAITPYGYGGPSVEGAPDIRDRLLQEGRQLLRDHFARERVVSEFIRYHPLLDNHEGPQPGLELERRSRTVAFDLSRDEDRLWAEMDAKCRNKVRRARKAGIVVEEDVGFRHLDAFHENYLATMRRAGAGPGYLYPRRFFEETANELKGHVSLFVALSGERVVNAAIILHRGDQAHYHFSGSHPDIRVAGANNLLLFQVAVWAKRRGMRSFHLGGGRGPDDSLFRFKASLSPVQREFWTGSAVHDAEACERLTRAAARRRQDGGPGASGFFPPYRA